MNGQFLAYIAIDFTEGVMRNCVCVLCHHWTLSGECPSLLSACYFSLWIYICISLPSKDLFLLLGLLHWERY